MVSRPSQAEQPIRFGECYELDLHPRQLRRGRHVIRLERIPLEILILLVERRDEIVTRDEIGSRIWGNGVFLDTDNSIRGAIRKLRRALKDDASSPRFIQTVTGQGYRFIAPVLACDESIGTDRDVAEKATVFATGSNPGSDRDGSSPAAQDQQSRETVKSPALETADHDWHFGQRPLVSFLAGFCVLVMAIFTVMLLLKDWGAHKTSKHDAAEQRITSNSSEAPVDSAVVSPDGKFVAYSDPTGLYLRVIKSGETRRWDLPKGFIARPNSWFPDGTHLLAMRWSGTPLAPSLWKLSLLGSAPQELRDRAVSGVVSPDGTRIVFGSFLPYWGNELWVMNADGSNPHKIADSLPANPSFPSGIMAAAWSLNGKRIACVERLGFAGLTPSAELSSLWTIDVGGGDLQVIFKANWLGTGLAWAQDGRILFSSRPTPTSERDDEDLRSIRVDEVSGKAVGEQQTVTAGAGIIGGISVTSDGKRLVLSRTNTHEQAFVSEFDPSARKWKTPRRLTLDSNGNEATAWLPDSRTVLFVSNRNGTWALFKQAIDEATAELLVEGRSLYLPRLSADGSQVLYGSQMNPADPSSPVSLMRLPLAGGPPQLVIRDVGLGNYQCAYLLSTLCIVQKPQNKDCVFFSFAPQGGIGRELFRIHDGCHNWGISPDGRTITDFPDSQHKIRFFSVANGVVKEDHTIVLKDWPIGFGDWTVDGKSLLVPSFTPTAKPVILQVNRTGKASVVLEGAAGTAFDFLIQAPDGRHGILGAEVASDNNVWLVDNF